MDSLTIVVCTARSHTIENTIKAILTQEFGDFELLVIDQCKTRDTESIVQGVSDSRIRYIRDHGVGVSRLRNLGLKLASGSIIAFTDDDCSPYIDWTKQLMSHYKDQPDISMIAGSVLVPRPPARFEVCPNVDLEDEIYKPDNSVPASLNTIAPMGANVSYRKEHLLNLGLWFDLNLGAGTPYVGEDVDMTLRLILHRLSLFSCADIKVEHVFGFRSGLAWLKRKRRLFFGFGARTAKYAILNKKELTEFLHLLMKRRFEVHLEKYNLLTLSTATPLSKGLLTLPKRYLYWHYFSQGYRDCLSRYYVDPAHEVLIPKGSTFEQEYQEFVG